ncbi:OLC1v1033867C1 [Oldenlandia corymbosa var. corymbosa]|uniref:OLC1v1033867C1 n=1 Tax=Oldenlandia corymbosa var. corymbosa TaxID=529605 RepID=A0AAV1CSD9_OLDCO|nr:OLC1v1033867C1 [Oldenlandia corymbosa var. corymbosa]
MQRAKEAASNVAASARSGMEKTMAAAEEKAEKMSTMDPARKEMAEVKRDQRTREAELEKQAAYDQNAAAKLAAQGGRGYGVHTAAAPGEHIHGGQGYTTAATGRHPATGVLDPTGMETPGVVDPDTVRRHDEGKRVGVQDPNVAGGTTTGYGAGSTV